MFFTIILSNSLCISSFTCPLAFTLINLFSIISFSLK
jgi:hypothetical protein